jgi:hypothetical protein
MDVVIGGRMNCHKGDVVVASDSESIPSSFVTQVVEAMVSGWIKILWLCPISVLSIRVHI